MINVYTLSKATDYRWRYATTFETRHEAQQAYGLIEALVTIFGLEDFNMEETGRGYDEDYED